MSIPHAQSSYSRITDCPTAYSHIVGTRPGEFEDSVGLLSKGSYTRKPKARQCSAGKVLLTAGILFLVGLAYTGGLLTEWRLHPLGGRFGGGFNSSSTATGNNATSGNGYSDDTELRKIDLGPIELQGTNSHADVIDNTTQFSFTQPLPADLEAALSDPTKQPFPPNTKKACIFKYKSHLGFDGSTPLGSGLSSNGRIERENVQQGYIGNCGFLAAILALIGNGQQMELRHALVVRDADVLVQFRVPTGPPPSSNDFEGFHGYRRDVVLMDDELPVADVDSTADGCNTPYIGSFPAPGSQPVLYVPLLEKAWAKYLDAHPNLRARNNPQSGYLAMEGTSPSLVLQSMTGFDAQFHNRELELAPVDGLAGFRGFILLCLRQARPCVLVTPNAKTLEGLDVRNQGNLIVTDDLTIATNANSDAYYDVFEKKTGRQLTLVGNHAYALDRESSDVLDANGVTEDNASVTIINPWGRNPLTGGGFSPDGKMVLSLRTLYSIMVEVDFIRPLT